MPPQSPLKCALLSLLAIAAGCGGDGANRDGASSQPSNSVSARDNLLLVILDDVSMDAIGCYGSDSAARTPTLDGIAARGIRFDTVWSNPMCSPTRATILTGRYSFRTGVGRVVKRKSTTGGLRLEETTLPEALKKSPGLGELHTAFFGKWHLSTMVDWPEHVTHQGFDAFRGTFGNLSNAHHPERYFEYEEWLEDGRSATRKQYATSATVDDVLAAAKAFGEERWFITASFHGAHVPLHFPPPALTDRLVSASERGETPPKYEVFLAMLEAIDTELGRLLEGLDPAVLARTHVVVVGDNGLAKNVHETHEESIHSKGTVFEPGIRVPLLIQSPVVASPGLLSHALVNTTDVFATCIELMGGAASATAEDAISLVPILRDPSIPSLRDWIFTERFFDVEKNGVTNTIDLLAVRDQRYKRHEGRRNGITRLFDLELDPLEEHDLVGAGELAGEAGEAYRTLGAVLKNALGGR